MAAYRRTCLAPSATAAFKPAANDRAPLDDLPALAARSRLTNSAMPRTRRKRRFWREQAHDDVRAVVESKN
jgi:hypothetical protein